MIQTLQNSPTQTINFRGKSYFLKRDDLLSREFSGNKARKLYHLLQLNDKSKRLIVSKGSSLSNAMYSLSVLTKMKGWRFIYYANSQLLELEDELEGNIKEALNNGMELRFKSFKSPQEFREFVRGRFGDKVIIVDEGGREPEAKVGIYLLAKEIEEWAKSQKYFNGKVFLPSGTGTTALYLSKFFVEKGGEIEVFTTPCVAGREYLIEQFGYLESDSRFYPKILESKKRYRFGKLYLEFYKVWLELQKETGVEFDLLYDPLGWIVMEEFDSTLGDGSLYIHQGGLLGNVTMIKRYEKKLGDRFDKDFK